MNDNLHHARRLCLDQAKGFVDAAERLGEADFPHIVYHLSLLALEEVGKASMLSALVIKDHSPDGSWIERSLESHPRKLLWALWSPIDRIDPGDFEAARRFADHAHARRLASLYVDAKADLNEVATREQVTTEDAAQALSLARTRLQYEQEIGTPTGEIDDLTKWFLEAIAEPNSLLLSKPFRAQYEIMKGDTRAWVRWAREEISRLEREDRELMAAQLARPAADIESAKPRWRANVVVYTPSHSLRPKVLARWNEKIEPIQLLWARKKGQFTLQITLDDNETLPSLFGRLTSLSKLVIACLNIGSIGYFWFEPPGFEHTIFKEVRDLELNRLMKIERRESFWGDGRAVALTDEDIDRAIHCMMAFAPLPDSEAEPIFAPYLNGLALIAKSDVYYSFGSLARNEFVRSLAGALQHYGDWNGRPDDFEPSFHRGFAPFMPDREHREKMFSVLKPERDPAEPPLENVRSAKQLADLYLISAARRTWQTILDRRSSDREGGNGSN